MRNYIVGLIIKISSDQVTADSQKVYLNKLNLVLVQILKQEWPAYWPNFIQEIVDSSKTSVSLCENNMVILKLLSEEIFDFSAEQMTSAKVANLKKQMNGEFSNIFQLCEQVLQKCHSKHLT
jgi:exportin-1